MGSCGESKTSKPNKETLGQETEKRGKTYILGHILTLTDLKYNVLTKKIGHAKIWT